MTTQLDHLVVLAATLESGVAWCERTLGVVPAPGGKHPLMGTHNRLVNVSSEDFPRAYLEVIAIDPAAEAPGRTRWFDMDDLALKKRIDREGPQLAHFAVRVPDLAHALVAQERRGIDRGRSIHASRMTAGGLLEWAISVRDDGQRLFDGALPTLIQWGATHPTQGIPSAGVRLESFSVTHPRAAELRAAFQAIGLSGIPVSQGEAGLAAMLRTPRGALILTHKVPAG